MLILVIGEWDVEKISTVTVNAPTALTFCPIRKVFESRQLYDASIFLDEIMSIINKFY